MFRIMRNYKHGCKSATGKKYEAKYTQDDFIRAISMVKDDKVSVYAAAKATGVPEQTLRRRILKGNNEKSAHLKQGQKRALSDKEERLIVTALKYCAKYNHPQDSDDIADIVQSYVTSMGLETPFKDGRPGKDWMISFSRRHANDIRPRKPEVLTTARAEAFTGRTVNRKNEKFIFLCG